MAATPPDFHRFSTRARRLLWIAAALVVGVIAGLGVHYKLDDVRAPTANRVSGNVAGVSATTLFGAIKDDSPDQVDGLIRLGANVNARDRDLETPLMHAAFAGIPQIVERLLSAGAAVNDRDRRGQTSLHNAASGNWDEETTHITALLVAADAIVDSADDDGQTALMLASRGESVSKLKILLVNGANPNAADNDGQTSLMYAVGQYTDPRHLVERIQLLIEHGADPNTQTKDGLTALDLACQQLELYSDTEFTGTQNALLAGAKDQVENMDLDPAMDAEKRKTFAELSRQTRESIAAAKTNYPIAVSLLRKLTKQRPTEEPGPDADGPG
jgi:hypothetical protein